MTVVVGTQIQASEGVWAPEPTEYTYQWQSSPNGTSGWTDIVGATRSDYVVQDDQQGNYLRCNVTAGDVIGFSEAAPSDVVGPVEGETPGGGDMGGPCTSWIDGDDVAACCNVETSSGVLFDQAATAAADLLFQLSGRQYAGTCGPRTVRPACDDCWCGYQILSRGHIIGPWDYGYPLLLCNSCLIACSPSMVKLAGYPIRAVSEVKINGDVVDPSEYTIWNKRFLKRLDDMRWPVAQDLTLADTEDPTFSITYTYGADAPELGVMAAAQLGCELYKACGNVSDCALPQGTTRVTRQGIVIERLAFTSWAYRNGEWRTGLPLVDAFLSGYNPNGIKRRPTFWAPGKHQYAQEFG